MNKKIIIKKDTFLLLILCLFFGVSITATNLGSSLRYVKYLIPFFFSIFLCLNYRHLVVYKIPIKNLQLFLLLILINTIYSLFTFNLSVRFFEEALLIIFPIFAVIVTTTVIKSPISKFLDYLFIVYAIIFVIGNIEFLFNINLVNDFVKALKTSSLPTESWMAFPFGLFSLFYILEKRKWWAIFSCILFLLAFKRISIAALLFALLFFWFFYKKKAIKFSPNKTLFWFVALNTILLIIIYNFIQGNYDVFIKEVTGLSPNHFTQGRLRIYTDTVNHFSENFLFGNSLGSTNLYLSKNFKDIHFLHSDILKLIVEFGVISYLIWMFYFFRINLVSNKAVPILIFMNLLFLTDNVFIYFDTLFIFYLLIIYYNKNENESDAIQ